MTRLWSTGFERLANKPAEVLRSPPAAGGKIGIPTVCLTGIFAVDPWPVDEAIIQKYELKTPRRAFQTLIPGTHDIREGDILVLGTARYNIKGSDIREAGGTTHTAVIMEQTFL